MPATKVPTTASTSRQQPCIGLDLDHEQDGDDRDHDDASDDSSDKEH
jgi:hypothetical protein